MGERIRKKKKGKGLNSFVIIFAIIMLLAILTWIIPGGQYDLDENGYAIAGTYQELPATSQGIWDVVVAPIVGMVGNDKMSGAISISLYILLFGSFLNMMDETGVIGLALNAVSRKFKKTPYLLITILTFIMSFLGTSQGAYEEGYIYVSLFLPIFLALGMDTITVLMISIFGTQIGCAASAINPFSTGIASDIAGISFGDGILERIIIFFVLTGLVSLAICLYARSVKAHPERSVQFFRRNDDLKEFGGGLEVASEITTIETIEKVSKRKKGVLVVFVATFVIMILALFPWTAVNPSWTFFDNITNAMNTMPIVSTVIGRNTVSLGNWYFTELTALMLVMTVLSGFIAGFDVNKIIDVITKGAASLISTALIVPLARGIQVIMNDGNITATILHATEETLGSLPTIAFVAIAFVIYLGFAMILPSSTGLAGATISIMVPLGTFAGVPPYVMIIIYNFALGLAKMVTPTSIIVMTCTQYAKVEYMSWIKAVWKPMTVFFVVCLAIVTLLTLIG